MNVKAEVTPAPQGLTPAPSIKAGRRWRARPLLRARGLLILASRANGQEVTPAPNVEQAGAMPVIFFKRGRKWLGAAGVFTKTFHVKRFLVQENESRIVV